MEDFKVEPGCVYIEDTETKKEYVPKVYKTHMTTEQHFEWYKDEVNRLMDDLGLTTYQYTFAHVKDKEYRAKAMYTADNRCSFILSTHWQGWEEPDENKIRTVARHEVAHALIGRIHIMAVNREFDTDTFLDELEAYAHRMEKYLTKVVDTQDRLRALEQRTSSASASALVQSALAQQEYEQRVYEKTLEGLNVNKIWLKAAENNN